MILCSVICCCCDVLWFWEFCCCAVEVWYCFSECIDVMSCYDALWCYVLWCTVLCCCVVLPWIYCFLMMLCCVVMLCVDISFDGVVFCFCVVIVWICCVLMQLCCMSEDVMLAVMLCEVTSYSDFGFGYFECNQN